MFIEHILRKYCFVFSLSIYRGVNISQFTNLNRFFIILRSVQHRWKRICELRKNCTDVHINAYIKLSYDSFIKVRATTCNLLIHRIGRYFQNTLYVDKVHHWRFQTWRNSKVEHLSTTMVPWTTPSPYKISCTLCTTDQWQVLNFSRDNQIVS